MICRKLYFSVLLLLHNVRMCAPVSLLKALGSEIHRQIFIHIHFLSLPNYLLACENSQTTTKRLEKIIPSVVCLINDRCPYSILANNRFNGNCETAEREFSTARQNVRISNSTVGHFFLLQNKKTNFC